MLADERLVPVHLDRDAVDAFYHHVANGVLWPLCHSLLDRLQPCPQSWQSFCAVSERFAEAAVAAARPDDVIWVNDYHLALVPALVRERLPEARIGFFLHIPFPSVDIFAALPWRDEFLRGLLGADVIGFHTPEYQANFTAALSRLLGAGARDGRASWQGRRVTIGAFPMGVDAGSWAGRANDPATLDQVQMIRKGASGAKILASVDRLDYTKGIVHRLKVVERLLETYPPLRTQIRFIQATVPSREQVASYSEHRRSIDELVGQINGAFATPEWVPIVNLHRSLSERELTAIYRAADVMLVTPLRDGMNLVAKEFVASRTDDRGVLILSEFAGASSELTEALIVNPFDADGTARRIVDALEMPPAEQSRRMRALRRHMVGNDAASWAASFLVAVEAQSAGRARLHRVAARAGRSHRTRPARGASPAAPLRGTNR